MAGVAFLFPGQGSQYVGMGASFLEECDFAVKLFQEAEDACGINIRDLCLNGPMIELTKTQNLQPCLTAVDMVCAMALMHEGVRPDAVAGHSLGEYPALWACGALELSDCLRLVRERGRLMEDAAVRRPGAMAAVIGIEREVLQDIIDDAVSSVGGIVTMANHNSREQIVVTGEKAAVENLCKKVKESGKRAIILKVAGAYHSPLMKDAADEFGRLVSRITFTAPSLPIYSNVSAWPETDPEVISSVMTKQMCSPVRWYDIVNNMYRHGVRVFIETGPKKVLSNLVRKSINANDFKVLNVEKFSDIVGVKEELSL